MAGKTHFGNESDIEDAFSEKADCGTQIGEASEFSMNWSEVTCKVCLKNRSKIEADIQLREENILEHMGGMVTFHANQ
ncbi:hypothetical protein [Vibrio rotiferianus]|uniref:hypothetical protein n=1 Tax=Vibrio rotiferianus TaxID=190895 RepID=UPI0005EE7369|nr:hypothetical protein [Vibrio rotiferianus]